MNIDNTNNLPASVPNDSIDSNGSISSTSGDSTFPKIHQRVSGNLLWKIRRSLAAAADPDEDDGGEDRPYIIENLLNLVAAISDREQRLSLYPNLQFRLHGELIVYGRSDDAGMIGGLRQLYMEWRELVAAPTRMALLLRFVRSVEQSGMSANVILPFVGCEPDRGIASTAAICFARLRPDAADKAMLGVSMLAMCIKGGTVANAGAVFGGLLNLGDYRVNKILAPLRNMIRGPDLDAAAQTTTGRMSAAVIDFLIEWLETMPAEDRGTAFGPVVSALISHRTASPFGLVALGGRVWPASEANAEAEERESNFVSFNEYCAMSAIHDRIEALRAIAPRGHNLDVLFDCWCIRDKAEKAHVPNQKRGAKAPSVVIWSDSGCSMLSSWECVVTCTKRADGSFSLRKRIFSADGDARPLGITGIKTPQNFADALSEITDGQATIDDVAASLATIDPVFAWELEDLERGDPEIDAAGVVLEGSYMDGLSVGLVHWSGVRISPEQEEMLWDDVTEYTLITNCVSFDMEEEEFEADTPGQSDVFFKVLAADPRQFRREVAYEIFKTIGIVA